MKTWISEVFAGIAGYAVVDSIVEWLTANPIIPDPFDKLVFGVLAVAGYFLRKRAKKA